MLRLCNSLSMYHFWLVAFVLSFYWLVKVWILLHYLLVKFFIIGFVCFLQVWLEIIGVGLNETYLRNYLELLLRICVWLGDCGFIWATDDKSVHAVKKFTLYYFMIVIKQRLRFSLVLEFFTLNSCVITTQVKSLLGFLMFPKSYEKEPFKISTNVEKLWIFLTWTGHRWTDKIRYQRWNVTVKFASDNLFIIITKQHFSHVIARGWHVTSSHSHMGSNITIHKSEATSKIRLVLDNTS
jgi:hypothetical protein